MRVHELTLKYLESIRDILAPGVITVFDKLLVFKQFPVVHYSIKNVVLGLDSSLALFPWFHSPLCLAINHEYFSYQSLILAHRD